MRWHRQSDVDRESVERARARLEVLDAMLRALDSRDEFFRVVAAAADHDVAVGAVMVAFDVDHEAATVMLGMQARHFTAGSRQRLADERASLAVELARAS